MQSVLSNRDYCRSWTANRFPLRLWKPHAFNANSCFRVDMADFDTFFTNSACWHSSYEGQVWIAQKNSETKSLILKNAVILGSHKKTFPECLNSIVWIALSEWHFLNRSPRAARWELRAEIYTKWKLMMRLLPSVLPSYCQYYPNRIYTIF